MVGALISILDNQPLLGAVGELVLVKLLLRYIYLDTYAGVRDLKSVPQTLAADAK